MHEHNSAMPSSFLERVIDRQHELELTDADMDRLMGFKLGRMWRRIKTRGWPMSLTGVPKLAEALQLDSSSLVRHAMQELSPDFLALVDEHLRPSELSPREARLINQFRRVTARTEPGPIVYYEVSTNKTIVIDGL